MIVHGSPGVWVLSKFVVIFPAYLETRSLREMGPKLKLPIAERRWLK